MEVCSTPAVGGKYLHKFQAFSIQMFPSKARHWTASAAENIIHMLRRTSM